MTRDRAKPKPAHVRGKGTRIANAADPTIPLSVQASHAIAEALTNPRMPTKRMLAAARRYLKAIGR